MAKSKTIWIFLGIIIIILIIGLFWYGSQKQGTIKIGLITPLSGDLANYGIGTKNAAQMALDEINQKNEKFELIVEDSPCNANSAITAVNKLINIDKVDVLMGPMCSSELLAISPIANSDKIVVISSSTTSPDITGAGDYVFRNVASDDLRAKVFARYIFNDKSIKEIAIIYENDDAGVGYKEAFVKEYEKLGGKISIAEVYDKGASDLRTQLTKIKAVNSSSILMLSYPSETGIILKQSKELGIESNFFEGFEIMMDPQVAQIAGDAVNGVVYIQSASTDNQLNEKFKKDYKAKYGAEPPYYAVEAYDIIKIYDSVIKDKKDLETIKSNLYTLKDFQGASGIITFDENGDVVKPFEIGQVQNGSLTPIKVI
jgi:branched-chain amino acid transport system substrate-binding protein